MKKMLSLLCLVGILFAFQAKLNANQDPKYPKYLVVNIVHGTYRYTDDDPDLEDDTCRTDELWLRYIPAGQFTMGSQVYEPGYIDCENLHEVELTQPFYIGVFECTQYQWAAIIDSPEKEAPVFPSWFRNEAYWETRPVERVSYLMIRGGNWPEGDGVDEDSFMGILRNRTGMMFDLPTEAQWEYACRAGTKTALNSGDDLDDAEIDDKMTVVGRYMGNSNYGDFDEDNPASQEWGLEMGTAKVGSYDANAWGLYDMHGNVLEWCRDWNFSNPYYSGTDDNPVVKDPVGESFYDPDNLAEARAVRGGGWCSPASGCRSAYRGASEAHITERDHGFRIVCLTMPDPEQLHTLTVTNGTTHKANVYAGETVEIKANNPPVGKVFDKWTSEDEDVIFIDPTDATTTFDMPNHNVTVTATYKPVYKLTVVNGKADKREAAAGETVTITANTPAENEIFYYWSGNELSGNKYASQMTFCMPDNDLTIKAIFVKKQKYTVTVENGSAEPSKAYPGEMVTITANTPTGMVFDKWTSDVVRFANEKAATTTFRMPDNAITVKATYKQKYTVTVTNGYADKNEYVAGETVTITADIPLPSTHMVFDKWTSNDNVTFKNAKAAKTTFVMPNKAVTVKATYKAEDPEIPIPITTYSMTVMNGFAQPSQAYEGETVTITAYAPPDGMVFDQWVCEIGGVTFANEKDATTTFTMPGTAVAVTATYKDAEIQKYLIMVENGRANKAEAAKGETVEITANAPAEHKLFDKWTGNVTFVDEYAVQTTFTMPGNGAMVTATYKDEPLKHTVTVVNGTADPKDAYVGERITITANDQTPNHLLFDHWEGYNSLENSSSAQTTFVMPPRDVTVTAIYVDEPIYTVTVANGTAQPSQAYEGAPVEITANDPADGKVFDKWTSEDDVTFIDPTAATTTFDMPGNDVVVTATYKDVPKYEVWIDGGIASKTEAYAGETITIEATPAEHKLFYAWKVEEGGIQLVNEFLAKTTFVMPDSHVIVTATYKDEPIYTVTVGKGTANPSKAYAGETITIKAETPLGSVFVKWTSEGVTIRNANEAETTFIMPANDVTVTAYYKLAPTYTVTVEYGSSDKAQTFEGDTVAIEAQAPAEHKLFDKWTSEDDVTFADETNARTTFTMLGKAVTVTATYKDEPIYTVTVTNGTADPQEAYAGDEVTITANDRTANHLLFDSWTGAVDFDEATAVKTTFVMPANDVAVTATYKDEPIYTVEIRGGMADKTKAYAGDTVSITAEEPEPGMVFDHWWDGNLLSPLEFADPNLAKTTFRMPARDVRVESVYSGAPTYRVTVKNGTANPSEAYAGQTVTIEANDPAEHYQFGSWTGAVDFENANKAKTTFVMLGKAVTVTATYLQDTKYTVTVVGGKASKKTAYQGEEITITANKPASGNAFDGWSGDVDFADATATPTTFTMPANNVTVTATFKTVPKTYKIVVVNGTADMAKAAEGDTVTLTANPAPAGKVFDRWTGGAVFVNPKSMTTTFTMPAKAVTPKAIYKKK